jgi:outer membrane protein TolC
LLAQQHHFDTLRTLEKGVVTSKVYDESRANLVTMQTDLRYLLGIGEHALAAEKTDVSQESIGTDTPAKEGDVLAMPIDAMLKRAMDSNPDIKLAKAKRRSAEAALNRTEREAAWRALYQQKKVSVARFIYIKHRNAAALVKNSVVQSELSKLQAEADSAEAELEYLIGGPSLDDLLPREKSPPEK